MDLNEFFDNIIAELKNEGARERSLKRTSAVAQGRFKRTLRSLLASRIDAMSKTGTGSAFLRTVEFSDNGNPEKVRLRIDSQRLSKSYRRTITVSNGELDLETVQNKAEELSEQVKEKLDNRKTFNPELGTIGEYLVESEGYSRQTAWLHENYEDRAEKAGFGEYGRVKAVKSYSTKPFRFKVKMRISPEHWSDESELESIAREKALDMFPEARATHAFVKTGINYARIHLTID